MRRRIIKQGNKSFTLTLPIAWIRKNKLDQGEEVDIAIKDNLLQIIPTSVSLQPIVWHFDLKNFDQIIAHIYPMYWIGHKAKKEHKTVHRKHFLASKEGKKFHTVNCPFAQNIKPKFKVTFKSKVKALNIGYKACSCIK